MFDNVEKPESSYSFWIFESISSLFFTKWRRNELTAETGMDITNCTFFQQIISFDHCPSCRVITGVTGYTIVQLTHQTLSQMRGFL